MPDVSQIPLNRVPFLDERNPTLVSVSWYRFLNNLFTLTGGGASNQTLGDVQVDPPAVYADQAAVIQTQLDGLSVAPAATPYADPRRYGDVYDTTTQTAADINTAYAATFNTSRTARGVTIGTTTSRIYVDRPGIYRIGAGAQFDKTGGAGALATLWLRVNGADIPASAVSSYVTTTNPVASQPVSSVLQMAAGSYFELVWAVADTTIRLKATAAAAPYPAIPSAYAAAFNITG